MCVHNSGFSILQTKFRFEYPSKKFRFDYHYYVPNFRYEYDQIQDSNLSIIIYQSFIRKHDHIYDLDLSIIVYQVVDEVQYHGILFLHFLTIQICIPEKKKLSNQI